MSQVYNDGTGDGLREFRPLQAPTGYRVQIKQPSARKWTSVRGGYYFSNGLYTTPERAYEAAIQRADVERNRTDATYEARVVAV